MPHEVTNEELLKKLDQHIKDSSYRLDNGDRNFEKLNRVLFGDKDSQEIGMKDKVDEIHKLVTKVDGVGGFLKWLIIAGGALGAIKLWMMGGGQ